jgi:hypothetical protein
MLRQPCAPLLQPTQVYVMPAYERGSVATVLKDICNR